MGDVKIIRVAGKWHVAKILQYRDFKAYGDPETTAMICEISDPDHVIDADTLPEMVAAAREANAMWHEINPEGMGR